jgi:hypothetical protein
MTDHATDFAQHNVIATYPDMEGARKAVGALEDKGIDASRISLLGPKAEDATAGDDLADTAMHDERTMDEHAGTVASGIAAGAGIGGVAGFLAGLAAFGIPGAGPVVAGGIWALSLGGAAAGSGVGLAATAYARIKSSEAWDLTYESVSGGNVAVGVHTDDERELASAVEVLRGAGASDLKHFDAEGTQLRLP